MESKMKVKVIMLATNEVNAKNQICKFDYGLAIAGTDADLGYPAQHLYFISNKEVQVGDWYIAERNTGKKLSKCCNKHEGMIISEHGYYPYDIEECKKVVATTDTSLNIPLIPQSFVEKYVKKNGVIDEVMIEMVQCFSFRKVRNSPKIRKDNTVIVSKVKNTWTRDEVIDLLNNMLHQGYTTVPVGEHNYAWKSSGINAALQTSSEVLDQIKLL